MDLYQITDSYFSRRTPRKAVNDYESIKSLIDFPMTQSQSIRLGTAVENILRETISSKSKWVDIKPENQPGEKERDHLFQLGGVTIYAELKSNLNLDSEKKKATREKAKSIAEEEHTQGIIVALRHYSHETLSQSSCTNFYEKSDLKVLPVAEYLNLFSVENPFGSYDGYKKWLNYVALKLVEEDIDAEHGDAAKTLMSLKS
jgi:hypothetical protein